MAIRTLLDHGVQQDHIIFVTFWVARTGGLHVLQCAFPKVKIICGAVDPQLKVSWIESYHTGMGDVDRSPKDTISTNDKVIVTVS